MQVPLNFSQIQKMYQRSKFKVYQLLACVYNLQFQVNLFPRCESNLTNRTFFGITVCRNIVACYSQKCLQKVACRLSRLYFPLMALASPKMSVFLA